MIDRRIVEACKALDAAFARASAAARRAATDMRSLAASFNAVADAMQKTTPR